LYVSILKDSACRIFRSFLLHFVAFFTHSHFSECVKNDKSNFAILVSNCTNIQVNWEQNKKKEKTSFWKWKKKKSNTVCFTKFVRKMLNKHAFSAKRNFVKYCCFAFEKKNQKKKKLAILFFCFFLCSLGLFVWRDIKRCKFVCLLSISQPRMGVKKDKMHLFWLPDAGSKSSASVAF
jgi:hypothetical protein